jgi:hypothetical protein
VDKKYDISLETMENLSHNFLLSTAEHQRKSLVCLIFKGGPEINHQSNGLIHK